MRELWQFTKLIRSKNAGPFELTFDIIFKDRESFEEVMRSGQLTSGTISQLYGVDHAQVRFSTIEELLAVKISMPRRVFSGMSWTPTSTEVNSTALWFGCRSTSPDLSISS